MPTTAHGAPYPNPLDGRAVPADLMALAEWVDSHQNYTALNSADRDSRYADLPPGLTVASSTEPFYVWLKVGTGNSWRTLYSDTGWITSGFTAGPEFENVDSSFRISQSNVDLYVRCTFTGTTYTAGAAGNMPDKLLITLPATILPLQHFVNGWWNGGPTGGGARITTSGNLYLLSILGNSVLTNGDTVDFTASWGAA